MILVVYYVTFTQKYATFTKQDNNKKTEKVIQNYKKVYQYDQKGYK